MIPNFFQSNPQTNVSFLYLPSAMGWKVNVDCKHITDIRAKLYHFQNIKNYIKGNKRWGWGSKIAVYPFIIMLIVNIGSVLLSMFNTRHFVQFAIISCLLTSYVAQFYVLAFQLCQSSKFRMKMALKLSTEYGIHLDRSWLLQS